MNTTGQEASVAIVVPVYNEEGAIRDTAQQLVDLVSRWERTAEIIVVDDGSTDGTGQELADIPGIRVIRHSTNRGYGAALKTGLQNTSAHWIVITDADGTYPNDLIPTLVKETEQRGVHMLVGARTTKDAAIPLVRRPAKWFITMLASYLAETRIPDLNSGLRVMKRQSVERFVPILPDGFSFTTTITLAMLCHGLPISYEPISYFKRKGRTKIRPIRDTARFIGLIVRITLYFRPMKVFGPASLVLFVLSAAAIAYRALMGGGLASVSVILFTAGIQVLSVGLLAELIDRRLLLNK